MAARRRLRRVVLYVALIALALVMVAPFYWTIVTALKQPGDVFSTNVLPDPLTLDNFRSVLTKVPFGTYFVNSVIVTASIVLLNVLFGTAAAYAFAKLKFPGRDGIFFVFLLTLMVPFQVNLVPLYRIMVELHKAIPAIGVNTYFGLIAPSAVQVFGIFLMRQFLRSIPDEVLESARMDGASEWKILRAIVFPLAAPGMATLAIFTLIGAWNDFLWPLIVTDSDSVRTLPVGLALLARRNTVVWGQTMAGTVLAVAPMVVAFLVLQRRFIEGLTAGSVKDVG